MYARLYILIFVAFFSAVIISCTKEKETEQDYPRVATGLATNISVDGVTFNGSFLQAGKEEIIDHGFVYGVTSKLNTQHDEKLSLGASTGNGSFTATANQALKTGETYYVSAYARNKDKIFYAEPMSFISKGGKSPEIYTIFPNEGMIEDTVMIRGKYFSQQNHNNMVIFGNQEAKIIETSDTAIKVIAPAFENNGFVDVFVTTTGQTSQKTDGFRYLKPVILDMLPSQGVIGDTIVVLGNNFRSRMTVFFDQTKAVVHKINGTSSAQVIVPACGNAQAYISVMISELKTSHNMPFIYANPEITGVSSGIGIAGDTIILQGRNFGYNKEAISAFFGEKQAEVIEANNLSVKVVVPEANGQFVCDLSVDVDGQLATGYIMFTYLKPEITGFSPSSGKIGSTITINGQYFTGNPNNVRVKCGDFELDIVSCTRNQIIAVIPNPAESALMPIVVTVDGNEGISSSSFEIISPWTKKSKLPSYNWNYTVSYSINNEGYVGLGQGNRIFKYNSIDDSWTLKAEVTGWNSLYPVFFQIDDHGYFGKGGTDDFYQLSFNSSNITFTEKSDIPDVNTSGASTFVIDGKAYIVCGGSQQYTRLRQYDPKTDTWTLLKNFPSYARRLGIAFSHNGKGYAGWGVFNEYQYNDLYEYNPLTDIWTKKSNFPGKEIRGAIAFIINGRIYVGLGLAQDKMNIRDIWEYHPDSDAWTYATTIPNNGGEGTFVFVINNKAYIGGSANEYLYEFDPAKL